MGITLPQAGQQMENVIQVAQNAEKEGFDSLWVFERLLWPINPQTPYPVTPDGSLPTEYQIMRIAVLYMRDIKDIFNKISKSNIALTHTSVLTGWFGSNTRPFKYLLFFGLSYRCTHCTSFLR